MKSFAFSDLNRQSGEVLDAALAEPVTLTKHGKPKVVMLSVEAFDRMARHRRAYTLANAPQHIHDELMAGLEEILRGDDDLWSREHRKGEIGGRKSRPTCLVVRSGSVPSTLFLFPIASRQPSADVIALAIGKVECLGAGLDYPSWIVLEEYNRVDEGEYYDFESLKPIGKFSANFMKHIAVAIKRASELERLVGVQRS